MERLKELIAPFTEILRGLFHWVESWAATPYGGWAIFLIAFAESSFFPIPPDVLLIALCLGNPSQALVYAALCSFGSILGGVAGYGMGYAGGRPLLKRFFKPQRVQAVSDYYDRYNAWAVGIAGLTPLPYKIFTLSAGALAIDFKIFALASVISRSVRFFAVASLIYFFGEPIHALIEKYFELASVLFVVVLVGGFWLVGKRLGPASKEIP